MAFRVGGNTDKMIEMYIARRTWPNPMGQILRVTNFIRYILLTTTSYQPIRLAVSSSQNLRYHMPAWHV